MPSNLENAKKTPKIMGVKILPPLLSIAHLVDVTLPETAPITKDVSVSANQDQQADNNQGVQQTRSLHVVTIPTMVIKQKLTPVFSSTAQPTAVDSSSSSGGSGNSKSSKSTAKSSKK